MAKGLLRRHPAGMVASVLAEVVQQYFEDKNPRRIPLLPRNYEWCYGPNNCSTPPANHTVVGGLYFSNGSGVCNPISPCSLAPKPAALVGPPFRSSHKLQMDFRTNSSGNVRSVIRGVIQRQYTISPQPDFPKPLVEVPLISDWPTDPNVQRWMPARTGVGYAEPLVQTEMDLDTTQAMHEQNVNDAISRAISAGTRTYIAPRADPKPALHPHARVAPDVGVEERKAFSKSKAIGVALYKALDNASEGAEVIDSIYDALPQHIKDRWDRKKRAGDNWGQYGLEGADWKLRAIYHNFDKIDINQAVKNIVLNQMSDSVIGYVQARLPVNTGSALEGGEIQFAKYVDKSVEAIFDAAMEGKVDLSIDFQKEAQLITESWLATRRSYGDWYAQESPKWRNPLTSEWTWKETKK